MVHVSLHSSDEIEYLNVMPPGAQAAAHTMHVHEECVSEYTFSRPTHAHTHPHTHPHTHAHTHHMHQTLQACLLVMVFQGLNHNALTFWTESVPGYLHAGSVSHAEWNYTGQKQGERQGLKKKKKDTSF